MADLRQITELNKNLPDSRKQFIRLVRFQDIELDNILDELQNDSVSLIEDNSRADVIQDMDTVHKEFPKLMTAFLGVLFSIMQTANRKTAEIQAYDSVNQVMDRYADIVTPDALKVIQRFEAVARMYPTIVENGFRDRGFPLDGVSVGQRISTIRTSSIDVVRAILKSGIQEGRSATQMAGDISGYIKTGRDGIATKPFTFVRDAFGSQKVQAIESGRIRPGNISYQAFRIARTEVNNTYRSALVELQRGRPWVKGYRWNLSASHPVRDNCDDLAKEIYTEKDYPTSHPNCMCYMTTEFIDSGWIN